MYPTRYTVRIESEEDGFHLIVESEIGAHYTFPLVDPEALYDSVRANIGPWLRERDEAAYRARAFRCDPDESAGMAEYVVAIREDGSYRVEPDEDAYDPTDPKSAGWRERMADAWDNRDKTERKPW